jgi:hypothetical protein
LQRGIGLESLVRKRQGNIPIAVGPNYNQYGEQPGYIYNPYTDHYIPDPKVAGQYTGQPDAPTPPGLGQIVGVPAAVLGAGALATEGGKGLGGLLSFGGKATTEDAAAKAAEAAKAAQAAKVAGSPQAMASLATSNPAAADAAYAAASSLPYSGAGVAADAGSAFSGATAGVDAGATNAAMAAPESAGLLGIGALPLAAIAAGTYLGGKSAYDMFQGKTDNSIPGIIGRGTLGIATGGLSELARHFMMRKTTRDIAEDHTKDLQSAAPDDQNYQAYVSGMRDQYGSAPTDPSKPFDGKYATFNDYKNAGLDASNLTGVYGNIKQYGPQWASLSEAQRQQVTQKNIDDGIYDSDHGEVVLTDPNKAQANFDAVIGGQQPAPQGQPQQSGQGLMSPSVSGVPQNMQTLTPNNTPLDQMKPPTGNFDSGFTVTIPPGVDPVDWIKQQQGSGNSSAAEKAPAGAPKQVRVKGSNGLYYWKPA